jgi:hypothetical protein
LRHGAQRDVLPTIDANVLIFAYATLPAQFHLANLYDGRNGKRLVFRKLYDDDIVPNGLAD